MDFEAQCRAGEAADALLGQRRFADADLAYQKLLAEVEATKRIDQFVVSKIALGLMLARIGNDDIQGAHAVWTASMDNGDLLGVGIMGLDNSACSTADAMLYMMISACLRSYVTKDHDAERDAINHHLTGVVRYAKEKNPTLIPMVLSNWRNHLSELRDGKEVPPDDLVAWQIAKNDSHPGLVPAVPTSFPPPARWVVDWEGGDQVQEIAPKKKGFFSRLFGG